MQEGATGRPKRFATANPETVSGPASSRTELQTSGRQTGAKQAQKLLDAGNFFGLAVIPDFYEMGVTNIGRALIEEKQPRMAVISAETVAEARDVDLPTTDVIASDDSTADAGGWGARDRTWEWGNQNPLPYRLATPHPAAAEHSG